MKYIVALIILLVFNIAFTQYRLLALENLVRSQNIQQAVVIRQTLDTFSSQYIHELSKETCQALLQNLNNNYPDNNTVITNKY